MATLNPKYYTPIQYLKLSSLTATQNFMMVAAGAQTTPSLALPDGLTTPHTDVALGAPEITTSLTFWV